RPTGRTVFTTSLQDAVRAGARDRWCDGLDHASRPQVPSGLRISYRHTGTMSLLDKLKPLTDRLRAFGDGAVPFDTVIDEACGPDDVVVLDVESHASIFDGARLSGAQVFAFRHNSALDLARKLARQRPGRCLVVVEGLYSIGGDVAPLADIAAACREAGALLA